MNIKKNNDVDRVDSLDYFLNEEEINKIAGKVFSTYSFAEPDGAWEDQREDLRKLRIEKLEPMNSARLTLLLNALRIFEYKLSEMTAFCNDGNFWKPAD